MDAVDAYHAGKAKPAGSLLEAFANTAKTLQQFGVERIRVVGLSKHCETRPADGFDPVDGVRVVTEQEFMRDFVFLSRPCILLDAIEDWPAVHKWRSDRYVFDLDGHLPHVEQKSTSSSEADDDDDDDDDDDEEVEKKEKPTPCVEAPDKTDEGKGSEPRPLGPRRFTIALTPNGRADAVTHVLYDDRDVPPEQQEDVFAGRAAQKSAVTLTHHPLLAEAANAEGRQDSHLRIEKVFMYAAEVKLTLPELYKLFLRGPKHAIDDPIFIDMRRYKQDEKGPGSSPCPVIAYAQLQNNCLNTEFTHVHADITTNVEAFGTRVFGEAPEAGNVWLGIPASVSSLHQDWVENLYPVVRGVKEFVLIPPWEGVFVPKPDIPAAAFSLDEASTDRASLTFAFKPFPEKDGTVVPWMDFDFTSDLLESRGVEAVLAALNESIDENEARKKPIQLNPLFSSGNGSDNGQAAARTTEKDRKLQAIHPLVAKVHPGETLYLPAMWLHRVAQHADETDIRARARARMAHKAKENERAQCDEGATATSPAGSSSREAREDEAGVDNPPLPLIAAVNYWYNMNFMNPAVVMLREFGLLL